MTGRRVRSYLAVAAFSVAAGLVTSSAIVAEQFVIVDDAGRSVVLNGPPERIVALAPSNTEILFALGVEDRVVAVDQWSDHPPAAKTKPRISPFSPSLEQIVKLRPDLILAAHGSAEPVLPLDRHGVKVLVLAPRTLEDVYRNMLLIGRIVEAEGRAKRLVDEMRRRVAAVLAKVRGAPRPKVFVELDGSDPIRPFTAGPGSFVDLLVQLAGGANVAASSRTAWPQLSLEELLRADPDMIILAHELVTMNPQTPQTMARRPGWRLLRAVREGSIYPIEGELLSRPGPRIVEGLELLARHLHPDRYR
ncbi:MAG TPA: ABC transporter substrate-binding protein [Candidatus Methylomirabilis sp.]|nr:ABC transporter substrate-binding protein [Candidatus Methylomirabilis sp.]